MFAPHETFPLYDTIYIYMYMYMRNVLNHNNCSLISKKCILRIPNHTYTYMYMYEHLHYTHTLTHLPTRPSGLLGDPNTSCWNIRAREELNAIVYSNLGALEGEQKQTTIIKIHDTHDTRISTYSKTTSISNIESSSFGH